jgi:exodeoxyribonuclease-5
MFNTIELTEQQQSAVENLEIALELEGEAVLVGPAGSGKTTVLRELIDLFRGRPICLLAPTGKAARRMTEVIGYNANTIHSALYGGCDEGEDKKGRTKLKFYDPQPPCRSNSLVVIDEASMVNRELYNTLKEQVQLVGGILLWVGDKEQLPPVDGTWGPDFDHPTAELTEIHRQAENSAIIKLATLIRYNQGQEFKDWGDEVSYSNGPLDQAAQWILQGGDRVCLTWTNKIRKIVNSTVRNMMGYTRPLEDRETILVLRNNRKVDVVNGDVMRVRNVINYHARRSPPLLKITTTGGQVFYTLKDCIGADSATFRQMVMRVGVKEVRDAVVHIDYGYCLTVHKSQGSQWRDVCFIECEALRYTQKDLDGKRRLLYTGITRAQERLLIHCL